MKRKKNSEKGSTENMNDDEKREFVSALYVMIKDRHKSVNGIRFLTEAERIAARTRCREWNIANKDSQRVKHRNWYLANKDRVAARDRVRKFGISAEEYDRILIQQKNRCKVCGVKFTKERAFRPCVDHCHKRNHFRGIICHRCNTVEGMLGSIKVAKAMVEYMEQDDLLSHGS